MSVIVTNLKEKLQKGEIVIKIKVIANAKQNSIEFYEGDIIKVKINKPAVDGKANKEIISYFCKLLSLPKNNVTILQGEKNSIKSLRIVPKSLII